MTDRCGKCGGKLSTIFVGDAFFDVVCLNCYQLLVKPKDEVLA